MSVLDKIKSIEEEEEKRKKSEQSVSKQSSSSEKVALNPSTNIATNLTLPRSLTINQNNTNNNDLPTAKTSKTSSSTKSSNQNLKEINSSKIWVKNNIQYEDDEEEKETVLGKLEKSFLEKLKSKGDNSYKASVSSLPKASSLSKYEPIKNNQNIDDLSVEELQKNNIPITSNKDARLVALRNKDYYTKPQNTTSDYFKSSEAFEDGYQFGDVTKTALSTAGDIGVHATKSIMGIGEGIGDLITYARANSAEKRGDIEKANSLRQEAQQSAMDYIFNDTEQAVDKNSIIGDKGDQLVEGLGYIAGISAIGYATGGLGTAAGLSTAGASTAATVATTATTFSTSMGNGMTEAYQSGASNDEAFKYGLIAGLAEAGSELLFGGLGKASGAVGLSKSALPVDDLLAEQISDLFKSRLGKNLSQYAIKASAEGVEEVVSGFMQAIGKKVTYMSDIDLMQLIKDENLLEQFIDGTILSAIAQSPSFVKSTTKGNNFLSVEDNGTKNQNNNTTQAFLQEQQQIIPQATKTAQNENMRQTDSELPVINESKKHTELSGMLNNKDLPMQYYQYEKSDNAKVNALKQSASKYFNNSEQTKNYISMLEQIVTNKGIEIKFEDNLKTPDGKIANGSYSDGVITINPNSSSTGEFIAIHELTHAIGTNEMVKMIENFKNSNVEFSTEMKALLNNYSSTEINEEALADVSAQLLGNQEFINNVAQNNSNIFKKIYNEIKYLWHQFRGYKNQNQFVEDLYYKWTKAYNSSNELNNTTSYSTETLEDGTTYVKAENNKFIKEDGTKMTPREAYQSLIGTTIQFSDGDSAKIVNRLPNKDMYNELSKRYPNKYKNVENIKEVNGNINDNIEELLTNTTIKEANVPDFKDRHQKQGIKNFDTRTVKFYDGNNAYDIDFSIAVLEDGSKVAYAKKYIEGNQNLTQKIKTVEARSEKSSLNQQSLSKDSITPSNNDVNTSTKYSIQESENNSGSFNLTKKDNKGRTLSQEQQEYFKNSKVRDENGNLKVVYHGTDTKFTVFNYDYLGKNGTANGKGFYFADNINIAKSYSDGKNIIEAYVNIEKPLSIGKTTMSENDYIKFVEAVNDKTDGILFADFGDGENIEKNSKQYNEILEQFREEYTYNGDDVDLVLSVLNGANMKLEDGYRLLKNVTGYDGIIVEADYKNNGETMQYTQYIPLTSEQIKNVDNTTPTDNPDIRYSTQSNTSWYEYLEKTFPNKGTRTNLQDILVKKADNEGSYSKNSEVEHEQEKIASILEKPVEKVAEKDRIWAIFKANLIDKGIVFEELSRKTNNRELQGKWDYTLSATARGQNAIGQARYEMDANTKTEKQICKSLEDIRAEVGNKTSEFQHYMYHQLNIDRMTLVDRFAGDTGLNYERKNVVKNKPVFGYSVTAEQSREIVKQYEKSNPEFKKWAQDVYDYNDANKQELVKSGVISQELSDKLSDMYPHYIPIKRVNVKGNSINVPLDTNRTGVNSPIAKAKGGNQDIQPLFETLADRTLQTYKASAKNSFGVELMNTLNSIQEKQVTDVDTILEEIGDVDSNNELLKEGTNGNLPTFTVFNNGEKVTFEISKDMFDALKSVSDSSILSKTIKPLNAISNARRAVLTEYNPLFLITNAIRDAQEVVINSQHSSKTYAKFPEAYKQIVKKGYWYNEYVRNGGEQNSYFKDGEFESDKKPSKLKTALKLPLDKISSVNNVVEMAPRLAEYIASRESGASIETAMLDAARVTTNFKAGGDVTKFANRNGATFLNASVQGFQQQVRNIQEANAKGLKGYAVLATKYAIAGMPAMILNALFWKDDEDYDELQDYVKDNYYIVGKYGDGKFIRIPKGRMAATMQKLVGNVAEYVTGEKELNIDNFAKDFWEDLKFTIDNVAPNNPLDNNVISPIIQVITNTSWYGEDIVPSRLQDKPKAEQYDETTDSFSIWLGDKLNISPYKINYLLDQYGGGVSDVVLPMFTKQAENNVVEDKFTTDSVMKSKYPGEFYDKLDEITTAGNSDKASDNDILASKYASSISEEMSKLYKEKREIQNSDLSDKEKKEKVKEVQEKINTLAKEGLENLNDFSVNKSNTSNASNTSNIATIGNEMYYKSTNVSDGSVTWQKVSDDEAKKIKNISLKSYANYKEQVAQETIKQRKNGTLQENQNLKDKDKIQILLNGNYSNNEKTTIYENFILDSDDKKYEIIKKSFTTKGLNITKYLKYKSQEFTSDKEDDGTVNGKTISGSKEDKVIDYINSISGTTYTQRILLYGLQYKPESVSDRELIVNYICDNWTGKERTEMLKQFTWITQYKNGKIGI